MEERLEVCGYDIVKSATSVRRILLYRVAGSACTHQIKSVTDLFLFVSCTQGMSIDCRDAPFEVGCFLEEPLLVLITIMY